MSRFALQHLEGLTKLYSCAAIIRQPSSAPVEGRKAIREMFAEKSKNADLILIVENIFENGEWGVLEWRDARGHRGCNLFHVVDDSIIFQRGYRATPAFLK